MKFIQFVPLVLSFAASTLAQDFCTSATHGGESVEETSNKTGSIGDVGYELWSDSGSNSATFYSDGSFSCTFSNAKDYLCRSGLSFDSTQTPDQIGHLFADFKVVKQDISNVDYSYVGIYGWTRDPLVEYYIVDNWLSPSPPGDWVGNKKHGDFSIDGAEYTVYENTRTGPSIDGDTTFKQYFSIRKSARECGTIDISAHFAKWEELGMTMGKLHEAKVLGEAGSTGSGTSGTADFPYAKVYIGEGNGGSAGGSAPTTTAKSIDDTTAGTTADSTTSGTLTTSDTPATGDAPITGDAPTTKNIPDAPTTGNDPTTKSIPTTPEAPNNNQDQNQGQQQQDQPQQPWDQNNQGQQQGQQQDQPQQPWDQNNQGQQQQGQPWDQNNQGQQWNQGQQPWDQNNQGQQWNQGQQQPWDQNNQGQQQGQPQQPWDQNNQGQQQGQPQQPWDQNNQGQQQGQQPWDQGQQWNQGQQQQWAVSNAAANCAGIWNQCGGDGFTGPTCCSEGTCKKVSEHFSQCQK